VNDCPTGGSNGRGGIPGRHRKREVGEDQQTSCIGWRRGDHVRHGCRYVVPTSATDNIKSFGTDLKASVPRLAAVRQLDRKIYFDVVGDAPNSVFYTAASSIILSRCVQRMTTS
jgi:hypothetical protein